MAACAAFALMAAGHTKPHKAKARVMPSLQIVSGSPQTQPAYATSGTNQYLTDFPQGLVVRPIGKTTGNDRVRFWCTDKHCTIRIFDEDNDPGKRDEDDKTKYNEVLKNGTATVRLSILTDGPGTYHVVAQEIDGDEEGPVSAPFILVSR